jgi:hypothetical protein
MKGMARPRKTTGDPFEMVREVGLEWTDVEATTRYDGSPRLTIGGIFLAGLATHHSAEPGTLVVRYAVDERDWLLADAPDTYYLTDYYRSYPLILARLLRLDRAALRDLLAISRRLTLLKTRKRISRTGQPNC